MYQQFIVLCCLLDFYTPDATFPLSYLPLEIWLRPEFSYYQQNFMFLHAKGAIEKMNVSKLLSRIPVVTFRYAGLQL